MFEEKFKPYLKDPIFVEVLDLVRKNSKGKIWIIGGFLYKNLANTLYGGGIYDDDIDFLVEERKEKFGKMPDWEIYVNNYGVENYRNEKVKTSITDKRKVIRVLGVKNPTIEKFISETPLNVQSIAYDLDNNMIIGNIGIEALKNKIVRVNNIEQAEYYAKRKGKKLEDIILEKARELNFNVI